MIPVLLCGGSGTRLWPVSRAKMPKQFISLLERSLFELSARRLEKLGPPYVVAIRELESLTKTFSSKMNLPADHVLSEPLAKNTAPAIALICRYLELRGLTNEVAGIFPADHVIVDEAEFLEAARFAADTAAVGGVVTLGIQPREPSTGFGYIEVEAPAKASRGNLVALRSIRFREKPDLETAKTYVASGRYFWNAGIFFFKVSAMIEIFERLAPEIWSTLGALSADLSNLESIYTKLPSISFDYAIMENLDQQFCVPCDLGWSDLGSWDDVVDFAQDEQAPVVPNRAITFQSGSQNCFAYSERDRTVAFVDLNDIVAIETTDATLLYKRGSSQNVKLVVDQMKKAGRLEVDEHEYKVRPWGRLEVLQETPEYATKLASVSVGQTLTSKLRSIRRNERWVVVAGEGELDLQSQRISLRPGVSIEVPATSDWNLTNKGASSLEIVEVHS